MSLEPNTIHQGDCIEQMNRLPEGSVDLVFADPPFNIGYEYDVYDDQLGYQQYLNWSAQWIAAVYRVLKEDGTFWLAIGDEYAAELKIESQKAGFFCRSWVVWYYTFGVNCARKFTRSHAHLFHFVKDRERFTFRDADLENRVPSARELIYNDRRANPQGRLPDDTWIIPPGDTSPALNPDDPERFLPADLPPPAEKDQTFTLRPQELAGGFSATEDTWHFSRVAGTFKERAGFHGCQMPEQLLGRIIRTCSYPDEFVLDPFSGSATTLAVAKKLGRRFIGFDLSHDYVRFGQARLEEIEVGDPLKGAAEPTKKAFDDRREQKRKNRKNGSKRVSSALRNKSPGRPRHAPKGDRHQPLLAGLPNLDETSETAPAETSGPTILEMIDTAGVLEAFRETHGGHSADRVVADPELNEAFTDACRRRSLAGDPKSWNTALFHLRKAGKLAAIATPRRTELPFEATDAFLYASEIAMQETLERCDVSSFDEVLCDPAVAARFDERARRLAADVSPLELRWAALQLRNLAETARVRGGRLTAPDPSAWQDPAAEQEIDLDSIPSSSGLYLIHDREKQPLYVGAARDLQGRFHMQFAEATRDAWREAAPDCTIQICTLTFPEAGPLALQSCTANQFRPRLNFRELY